MENDMKYFEIDGCIIAAYKIEDATGIYVKACNVPFEEDVVELSYYEALGKFTEAMGENETFLDGYGLLQFFRSTRNEILLIK